MTRIRTVSFVNGESEADAMQQFYNSSNSPYFAANFMNYPGEGVTAVGYGATPFTEGASLALIPVGQGIEKTSTAIQFGFDLHDGKYKDAGFTVASEMVFGGLGKTVDKAADVGKITKTDQGVLNFFNEALGKVTDFFMISQKTKNNEF